MGRGGGGGSTTGPRCAGSDGIVGREGWREGGGAEYRSGNARRLAGVASSMMNARADAGSGASGRDTSGPCAAALGSALGRWLLAGPGSPRSLLAG
ncbi:MAG TPA: hypothetical protein VFS00_31350, partial [Polyangiaceae bacterium]|nr:hypothetical protein [Polyangiaceae bacterium]